MGQTSDELKPQMPQMMADHRRQMGAAMADMHARMGESKQMMDSGQGSGRGGHKVMAGQKTGRA